MPEERHFLAAIRKNPDDRLPRLVYADWLDENGDPARAEFIRLQIGRENGTLPTVIDTRERVLLEALGEKWLAPLRQPGGPLGTQKSHAEFRRGFVEKVWLPGREFARHAERLFSLAPVNELRLILGDWFEVSWMGGLEHLSRLKTLDVCDPRFGPASGGEVVARTTEALENSLLRSESCQESSGATSTREVSVVNSARSLGSYVGNSLTNDCALA